MSQNSSSQLRSTRRRRRLFWGVVALLLVLLLNGLAWRHARCMMRFGPPGQRTAQAERLDGLERMFVLLQGPVLPRPENSSTPRDVGIIFTTQFAPGAHGTRLEFWTIPMQPARGTVLLFHGYAGAKESLIAPAQAFRQEGFRCVLVDFHGSGGSSGRDTTIGWDEAEDVATVFRTISATNDGKPIILYGPSMGAVAILRAVAVLGISPDAIILECPFDRLLTTVQNRFRILGVPSFPAAQLLVFWGGVQAGFNGFSHNPMDYARAVRCPALLMSGDQDQRARLEDARAVFDALPGRKRIKVFAGLGHESYLTAQPEVWKAEVRTFLQEQLSSAANKR